MVLKNYKRGLPYFFSHFCPLGRKLRGLSLDPPALAGIGNVKDMKRLNNHDMDTGETKPRKYRVVFLTSPP